MTPATPKPKEMPKDPKYSQVVVARAKAPALLAQELAATTSASHEEDDELAKSPDSTPQAKET